MSLFQFASMSKVYANLKLYDLECLVACGLLGEDEEEEWRVNRYATWDCSWPYVFFSQLILTAVEEQFSGGKSLFD